MRQYATCPPRLQQSGNGDAESGGDDVTVALTSRQVRAGGAASTLIERRHEAVIGRRAVT